MSSPGTTPNPAVPLVNRLLDIERALLHRGANTTPHSGRSLQRHLVGTYEILEHWQQRESLCLAGLLHSAYSTEAFKRELFSFHERALVRSLIGQEAEALVFLFCSIRRDELLSSIQNGGVTLVSGICVRDWRGGDTLLISPSQAADLLLLHVANTAEQCRAADCSPVSWLAAASEYASCASAFANVTPAIFSGCTARISAADEETLLSIYCLVTSTFSERAPYISKSLLRAAEAVSCVGEPFVWLGLLYLSNGELHAAVGCGRRAIALLDEWGTAWDKRLSYGGWRRLANYLVDLGSLSDSETTYLSAQTRSILGVSAKPEAVFVRLGEIGALESDEEALQSVQQVTRPLESNIDHLVPRRFAEYVAELADNAAEPRMMTYPGLTSTPWYDAKEFALVRDLERMAPQIAQEFRSLNHEFFHSESEGIARQGNWDVMILVERGRRNRELCIACPVTMDMIEAHRTVLDLAGLAYFSRLGPRTRVAAHKGPTNMRLRCHLGIDIPDNCGIEVDGVERRWQAGKCIVFDDSLSHQVWNDSDYDRIVLIVDLWHPDLTVREIDLIEGLHRYAHAHAGNLLNYWEKNARSRTRSAETPPRLAGAIR